MNSDDDEPLTRGPSRRGWHGDLPPAATGRASAAGRRTHSHLVAITGAAIGVLGIAAWVQVLSTPSDERGTDVVATTRSDPTPEGSSRSVSVPTALPESNLVPWVDIPAPDTADEPILIPRYAPPCTGGPAVSTTDPRARHSGVVPGGRLRPATRQVCMVPATGLRIEAVTADGTRWPVSLDGGRLLLLLSGPDAVVTLGSRGAINKQCPYAENPVADHLEVTLPGEQSALSVDGASIRARCSPQVISPDGSGPALPLTAQITVSEPVTPGGVLHYTVALRNRTDHTVTFDQCPGYGEGFTVAGTKQAYSLNCPALPQIEPRQSIGLAMQVLVPPGLTAPDSLSWHLHGYRAGDTEPVTVTGH